jgi:hypothetical protein
MRKEMDKLELIELSLELLEGAPERADLLLYPVLERAERSIPLLLGIAWELRRMEFEVNNLPVDRKAVYEWLHQCLNGFTPVPDGIENPPKQSVEDCFELIDQSITLLESSSELDLLWQMPPDQRLHNTLTIIGGISRALVNMTRQFQQMPECKSDLTRRFKRILHEPDSQETLANKGASEEIKPTEIASILWEQFKQLSDETFCEEYFARFSRVFNKLSNKTLRYAIIDLPPETQTLFVGQLQQRDLVSRTYAERLSEDLSVLKPRPVDIIAAKMAFYELMK